MKAHRTDLVSFAFGLTFLALALWWLLARILGLTLPPVGWFLAGALVLIGVFGLVGALRSGRHTGRDTAGGQPEATVAAPYLDGTPTTGAPVGPAADEWATDAVTEGTGVAREDRPFDTGPRWSPFPPSFGEAAPDPTGPVTRELPVAGEPAGPAAEPGTRELPAVDASDGPEAGRRTGGDGSERSPG
ncbi:hypothetical protein GA0070611_3748 [Micromonospora auratinigra]|uniref:Uncharacterized protein n=1 Tax=Micromonospora auratinigra TaxID=261654 RepID=A0A1A8ZUA4_9ACTN|nr:hypothetical protein GA0070611_3748 [Micromonospora auratinigra]